jgi:flagellar biosynthesis/type III secretory pathway protein FliH
MKKLSNDHDLNTSRTERGQSWAPASLDSGQPKQVPAFLFENNGEGRASSPGEIIKNGQQVPDNFQSWTPLDVIEDRGWEQPLPQSIQGGNGGFPNLSEASGTPGRAEAEMEKLLVKAERKAERMVRQEQEQRIQSARSEAKQLLAAAEAVLREMEQTQQQLLERQEESILRLVLEIAQNLFGGGFELDPDALQQVLQDALLEARELGELTLYLNPEDQEKLDPHWPEQFASPENNLRMAANPDIQPGGCLVEGEFGLVDARVSTKLANIKKALLALQTAHQADQNKPTDRP